MDRDQTTGQPDVERETAFRDVLSRLKRRGSLLLLVAPAPHGAISTACTRLLGDPCETRRRLFVTTGERTSDHHGVASLRGPERRDARAITYETVTRSAAAADPAESPAGPSIDRDVPTRTVDGGLGRLLECISEEIAAFEEAAGGLEPAELRICLDSLDALVARHEEWAVFRFLHLLSGLSRRYGAMSHVHLPADVDSRVVTLFEPTCDAVVEVREASGHQQRWHVPSADLTTDWLLL